MIRETPDAELHACEDYERHHVHGLQGLAQLLTLAFIDVDSRARTYSGLLAMFIRLRDQTCRTPFCNAPIRHVDHIASHTSGGPTSERNAEGLCERCNYDKEHADHDVTGDASQTTTRTGSLTAASRPPAPPGMPPPTASYVERTLIDITWNHHTGKL